MTHALFSVQDVVENAKEQLGQRLVGMEKVIEYLFVALLTGGHILLEDVPGVGKTSLAKEFAALLGLSFNRVQCTPDLLPSDITGSLIYQQRDSEFVFRRGPVFAHVLLVDEINRALPRTQSALLQAMAESCVTVDQTTYALPQPFIVIATQNPLESSGVFELPEAQLDRFLLKTSIGYPNRAQALALLKQSLTPQVDAEVDSQVGAARQDVAGMQTDLDEQDGLTPMNMQELAKAVDRVYMAPLLMDYVIDIVECTRHHPRIEVGVSPRGMLLLAKAAKGYAAVLGRDYVIPDDIKSLAPAVLNHRIVRRDYALSDADEVNMTTVLASVPAPVDGNFTP